MDCKGRLIALAAAALFGLGLLTPGNALAAGIKGNMQIGLSYHYALGLQDASIFDPSTTYGVVFQYWLNSTTTIMAGFDSFSFEADMQVMGEDEGITYVSNLVDLGIRYHPELDLWVDPYFQIAVGYQNWSTSPGDSDVDGRSGGSIVYMAGTGLSYEFRHLFVASLDLRCHYMPMSEKIEKKAYTTLTGDYKTIDDPLEDVYFMTAGVELMWRFR